MGRRERAGERGERRLRSRRLGSNSPGTRKWKRRMERRNLDEERERNRTKKKKKNNKRGDETQQGKRGGQEVGSHPDRSRIK